MTDEVTERKKPGRPPKKQVDIFKNISRVKITTSRGVVRPGAQIELPVEEAEHPNLREKLISRT